MTAPTIDEAFLAQVEPLRRELTAHCYRMLGSVHEAEDLVQETYLKAWRAFHGFEHRSSVRTWMYQIATNTCLSALRRNDRRVLPSGLGNANSDPRGTLEERHEVPWLEPLPDSMIWGEATPDPAEQVISRESVRLAFVALLQHLTPQQRAVVVLRDVLAWKASEVAELLEVSVASVNSSLQRARAHLAKLDHAAGAPADAEAVLENYIAAFEDYDVSRIVSLLTENAVMEMPPFTGWYSGPADIGTLISEKCPAKRGGDLRMVRTSGNGAPVLGVYLREQDGVHRKFQLQQLTLAGSGVAHVVCYFDTELFARFGLPDELPD